MSAQSYDTCTKYYWNRIISTIKRIHRLKQVTFLNIIDLIKLELRKYTHSLALGISIDENKCISISAEEEEGRSRRRRKKRGGGKQESRALGTY